MLRKDDGSAAVPAAVRRASSPALFAGKMPALLSADRNAALPLHLLPKPMERFFGGCEFCPECSEFRDGALTLLGT